MSAFYIFFALLSFQREYFENIKSDKHRMFGINYCASSTVCIVWCPRFVFDWLYETLISYYKHMAQWAKKV